MAKLKAVVANDDPPRDDLAGQVRYASASRSSKNCRVSLRDAGAQLVVTLTSDAAAAAGIKIGDDVVVNGGGDQLTIAADGLDGNVRVRRGGTAKSAYPQLLLPVRPGAPFQKVTLNGSGIAEHRIDDAGRLRLTVRGHIETAMEGQDDD